MPFIFGCGDEIAETNGRRSGKNEEKGKDGNYLDL